MKKQVVTRNFKITGIILATIFMFYSIFAEPFSGLEQKGMRFLGIFIWCIVLLVTNMIPDHIATTMALVVIMVTGVAPFETAFSPFAGTTCWLLIASYGIGAGLANSGILKRIALYILKLFPGTYAGQLWATSIASIAIAPAVPTTAGKATFLVPLVGMIGDELGYEPHSKGAVGLFSCCNTVTNMIGVMFKTGAMTTTLALGLYQGSFTWMGFLKFTIVWGIVLFFLTVLFHLFYYNPNKGKTKEEILVLDKSAIQARIDGLGKMTQKEIIALAILLITLIMWITESVHGISVTIVAIAAWLVFCVVGLFDKTDFSKKIYWNIFIFVGGLMSLTTLSSTTGFGKWVSTLIGPAVQMFYESPFLIVIGCAVMATLLDFSLCSFLVSGTLFLTLMSGANLDMFCVLFACETGSLAYVMSFQQPNVVTTLGVSGGRVEHKDIVPAAWAYIVSNLIALAVSVPYWQLIGYIY